MYISIYNSDLVHLANITNVSFDLTQRTFDKDTFIANGHYRGEDLTDATLLILNSDKGTYIYSSLIDNITVENSSAQIKGLDFRELLNVEIVLDYNENLFDPRLFYIFRDVFKATFDNDPFSRKIAIQDYVLDYGTLDTSDMGSFENQRIVVNAYTFLLGYLKYYDLSLFINFSEELKQIMVLVNSNKSQVSPEIKLKDFNFAQSTTVAVTNKTVAIGDDGVSYFFLTSDNQIIQADSESAVIENRLYPVRTKIFEADKLGEATFNAAFELATNRYVENIEINHNSTRDPIDLINLNIGTLINVYDDKGVKKVLPIAEKTRSVNARGDNTTIKLGYKKILLTEIIKAKGG